jgi:hypothetical protein
MRQPKPRQGRYYGAPIHNIEREDGTWLEGEEFAYPNGGMTRRCYALWEDGQKRLVKCGIPDTFFSVPASGRRRGKTVPGFVTSNEQGFRFNESPALDSGASLEEVIQAAKQEGETE